MSGKRAKRLRREESGDGEDAPRTQLTRAEARALFKRADAIGEFIAADADFNNALAAWDDAAESIMLHEEGGRVLLDEVSDEAGALAAIDAIRDETAADGNALAAAARAAALAVRADAVAQGYPPDQAVIYAVAYVAAAKRVVEDWPDPLPFDLASDYADEFACRPYGRTYAAAYTERIVAGDSPAEAYQAAREAAKKADDAQSQAEFESMLDAYDDHLETRPGIFIPALYRHDADEEEWV